MVFLIRPPNLDSENENVNECLKYLEASPPIHSSFELKIEEAGKLELKPPRKEPPKPEIKPLPSNIKYTFLGQYLDFSIFINGFFSNVQKEKLLRVFREH